MSNVQATFRFLHPTRYFSPKGFFKNYVYKTRQVGGTKMSPFVNVYTIEKYALSTFVSFAICFFRVKEVGFYSFQKCKSPLLRIFK